jgi:sugar O-acyltransferase (sialic acid O-acetyltransferase NeuD family)
MPVNERRKIVIFGSAEIAVLARYYFDNDSAYEVVAFTVDDEYVKETSLEGLPVVPFTQVGKLFPAADHAMHVALSYKGLNRLRREKYEQAKIAGYHLASYVCSKSVTWPDLSVGDNCFILENQTIQPTVSIGSNVMIWSGNHIGHGARIGDHTYVASHVVISGHAVVGQSCFLGVNATLRDFVTVGDGCFVAMDASVNQNVPDGAVVLGQGGSIIPADDRRARVLKSKYFGA